MDKNLVIGIIVGLLAGYTLFEEKGRGLLDSIKTEPLKEEGKYELILGRLKKQKAITNNDVEELLNVSDATAGRYLQKLEDDKKIKQHGKTGQGVYYTLVRASSKKSTPAKRKITKK
jgi:predicted HTH transcriptional regulator